MISQHFDSRQHEYSHTGETPFECKIPGAGQQIAQNRSWSYFSQIVTRSSRQSSSWRGTFWSTARQRLFSVMFVIERFDARIIWGITRKFMTPGRPSTLAPMITVPGPTTQWQVSENTRLVGSQKLNHKRLSVLLFVSDLTVVTHPHTYSWVAEKGIFCICLPKRFWCWAFWWDKHWQCQPSMHSMVCSGNALCRRGPAWLQNLQNDALQPGGQLFQLFLRAQTGSLYVTMRH